VSPSIPLARPLGILDILIIAALIIIAAVVIYFLWPLIVIVVIIGVGYYIYKWYKRRT
jgi:hypothetical protein